jgi:hypothetical protein
MRWGEAGGTALTHLARLADLGPLFAARAR